MTGPAAGLAIAEPEVGPVGPIAKIAIDVSLAPLSTAATRVPSGDQAGKPNAPPGSAASSTSRPAASIVARPPLCLTSAIDPELGVGGDEWPGAGSGPAGPWPSHAATPTTTSPAARATATIRGSGRRRRGSSTFVAGAGAGGSLSGGSTVLSLSRGST